ncbi:MAG: hypothetical protein ABI357_00770 [Granulicella sp.]
MLSSSMVLFGQDDAAPQRRGRKYKAPPETSHIVVTVVKASNGKPVVNAGVVFHPMKDGKDDGNLEIKTDPDGKATIDVIPTGSDLRVQVIASGFATFGEDYKVDSATKEIAIELLPPRAQVSAYTENENKPSQRKAGVQEPIRPKKPGVPPVGSTSPATPPVTPPLPSSTPAAGNAGSSHPNQ